MPAAASEKEMSSDSSSPKGENEPQYLNPRALTMLSISLMLVILIIALDASILATAIPQITDHFHTIKDSRRQCTSMTRQPRLKFRSRLVRISVYVDKRLLATSYRQDLQLLLPEALFPRLPGRFRTRFPDLCSCYVKQDADSWTSDCRNGSLWSRKSPVHAKAYFVLARAPAVTRPTIVQADRDPQMNGLLTILAISASPTFRPTLMGIFMSMAGAGQLIGPLIGGAFTEHVSWRWCFYINLPVGAVTFLATALIPFPPYKARKTTWTFRDVVHDFDITGFTLFAPA